MAYLDLHQEALLPRRADAGCTYQPVARAALGNAEHHVLHLSRRDPRSSLIDPGSAIARARRILGLCGPNMLADPRLEALRRFAILLRCKGERLPACEDTRLRAAGFTAEAVGETRRLIGREAASRRPAAAHRRMVAAVLVAIMAVQLLICRMLSAYLEDGLVGILGTLVATLVAIAPLRAVHALLSAAPRAPAGSR